MTDLAKRARRAWRALEPVHGMIYFAEEAQAAYRAIGIEHHRTSYFSSRAAAFGPVPAEVVIATFFNFNPALVRRAIPKAWEIAAPERLLAARLDGADRALRAAFGDSINTPELADLAKLARTAALAACARPAGRPLFAAHAALPWPDEPHLIVWHAQTLLREFRGDGHIAMLLSEGLTGIEALVVHGATGDVPPAMLQASRGWPDDDWHRAVEQVRGRGWIDAAGALTDAGRAHRQHVEDRTDVLAAPAYAPLAEDDAERLVQLSRRFSRMVVDAGLLKMSLRS